METLTEASFYSSIFNSIQFISNLISIPITLSPVLSLQQFIFLLNCKLSFISVCNLYIFICVLFFSDVCMYLML